MNLSTKNWLHGLGAAFIGGGAAAVTAGVTLSALKPDALTMLQTFELMGILFIVNGAISSFAYLQKSPLPTE